MEHDNHGTVANAKVTGVWSGAKIGIVSGTTGSDGTVTFSTGNMKNGYVTFTVSTLTYIPTANHDPDGDSNGNNITITK